MYICEFPKIILQTHAKKENPESRAVWTEAIVRATSEKLQSRVLGEPWEGLSRESGSGLGARSLQS